MLGVLTCCYPAPAITQFTGAVGSNWEDAGNWSAGLPTTSNAPFIPVSIPVVFINSFQPTADVDCRTFLFALPSARLVMSGSNKIQNLDNSGFIACGSDTNIGELRWVTGTMVGTFSTDKFTSPNVGVNVVQLGEPNGSGTWIMSGTSNFLADYKIVLSGFSSQIQAGTMNVSGSSLVRAGGGVMRNDGTIFVYSGTNDLGSVNNQGFIYHAAGDTKINANTYFPDQLTGGWAIENGFLRFQTAFKSLNGPFYYLGGTVIRQDGGNVFAPLDTVKNRLEIHAGRSIETGATILNLANTSWTTIFSGGALTAPSIKLSGVADYGGTVTGSTTILNGGVLNGLSYAKGNLTNEAGGMFKPGNATLVPFYVDGLVTLKAGSTTSFRCQGPSAGQYDSLVIDGNANLGGTIVTVPLSALPIGGQVTLIEATGSITGKFENFVSADSRWYIAYEPNKVLL